MYDLLNNESSDDLEDCTRSFTSCEFFQQVVQQLTTFEVT